jgi:hypothetical protein
MNVVAAAALCPWQPDAERLRFGLGKAATRHDDLIGHASAQARGRRTTEVKHA